MSFLQGEWKIEVLIVVHNGALVETIKHLPYLLQQMYTLIMSLKGVISTVIPQHDPIWKRVLHQKHSMMKSKGIPCLETVFNFKFLYPTRVLRQFI